MFSANPTLPHLKYRSISEPIIKTSGCIMFRIIYPCTNFPSSSRADCEQTIIKLHKVVKVGFTPSLYILFKRRMHDMLSPLKPYPLIKEFQATTVFLGICSKTSRASSR
ncbi:hypothetical protein V8G54_024870 [Vigna mungo]|uniref:Uncharacterized protein n=1 Tax=Vigna mungo TaxID=3915 RepID=A0AAQ3N6P2_VIGMU